MRFYKKVIFLSRSFISISNFNMNMNMRPSTMVTSALFLAMKNFHHKNSSKIDQGLCFTLLRERYITILHSQKGLLHLLSSHHHNALNKNISSKSNFQYQQTSFTIHSRKATSYCHCDLSNSSQLNLKRAKRFI